MLASSAVCCAGLKRAADLSVMVIGLALKELKSVHAVTSRSALRCAAHV
jgi:hypothetical protein